MGEFLILAFLATAAFFILATLALIGLVLKVLFWVVFFPIRIVLKLTFGVLGLVFGVMLLPIVLVIAAVAVLGAIAAAIFAILAPLTPLLLLALVGWAISRASSQRPSPVM